MSQSNSNSENELDALIGRAKQGRRASEPKKAPTPKAAGLRPSDILFMPENQAKLANYLSRIHRARLIDIQEAMGLPQQAILDILSEFKAKGYLKAALTNGEIQYHIKFVENITAPQKTLPQSLWNALRPDDTVFLKNVVLFKECNEDDLEFIRSNSVFEHYERNDILLWQGEPARALFIIKSGVVAVTNVLNDGSSNLLTYLEQGDFFGEGGLLTGRSSSATITAFTPVDVLMIPKEQFYNLLKRSSSVAVELSRVLANRLSATNARLANERGASNLLLVISAEKDSGATTFGLTMALKLSQSSEDGTGYVEFPHQHLPALFGFAPEMETYEHPGGFKVINQATNIELPQSAQAALVIDQAARNYSHIVACIPWEAVDQLDFLIASASQIILIAPRKRESLTLFSNMLSNLRTKSQANKTRIYTILNQISLDQTESLPDTEVDISLPYMENLPPPTQGQLSELPEPLVKAATSILDMLGYTNQVGIYIPTTIGVDQQANTTIYVDQTLAFMGRLFGGATHEKVRGVWNSDEVGIVAEDIHLVRSFCSPSTLDEQMSTVVDYMERLKQEMKQEAMALEINSKLMLI